MSDPGVLDLLIKMMGSNKMVKDPQKAVLELATRIHLQDLGLFVVVDGDEWKGAILCQRSRTQLNPATVVLHIYVEGGAEPRNLLVEALFNYAKEGGYNDIIAIDTNNKPKAFGKLFGSLGKPTKLGDVFQFDMTESLL